MNSEATKALAELKAAAFKLMATAGYEAAYDAVSRVLNDLRSTHVDGK